MRYSNCFSQYLLAQIGDRAVLAADLLLLLRGARLQPDDVALATVQHCLQARSRAHLGRRDTEMWILVIYITTTDVQNYLKKDI